MQVGVQEVWLSTNGSAFFFLHCHLHKSCKHKEILHWLQPGVSICAAAGSAMSLGSAMQPSHASPKPLLGWLGQGTSSDLWCVQTTEVWPSTLIHQGGGQFILLLLHAVQSTTPREDCARQKNQKWVTTHSRSSPPLPFPSFSVSDLLFC